MNQKTITTLSEPETESVGQGLPVFGPVASHDTLVSVEGWLRRRYRELLITLVMFLVIFLQHPGRIVRDTKLDLSIDPGRFLGDVTHLWDAQIAFGSVPDQAYGYLFPMGPFYWLGSALHAPVWVVQRFWLALLLSVAFWGALKMAEVFRVGVPWTRLVGAAGYALSPWMLAQAHDTSYILPAVMLPWVMVPLKRAGEGTLSARSAAARSGLAVLFMGGINASLTFAVLLLPLLWFVAQSPRRRMIKLFGLWCLAVFLATAWFVLPLIFQGRYGLNFLPYTETASATTANTTVAEILRGGGIWTSYGGVPVWSTAGLLIETGQWVIVATALMAGTGLFGLARRDMPDRRFFGLSVIVGALIVCAGYNGHLGGPWAGHYQSLLNGSLALFRNVYKFQPLILLPLSLGISHALARLTVTMRGFNRSWGAPITAIFSCGVVTVLGLAAAPIFTAQIYPNGSFTSIPGYYQDAMNWLNARGAMSTTLVLPGVDFTRTTWGDPLDNPVQVQIRASPHFLLAPGCATSWWRTTLTPSLVTIRRPLWCVLKCPKNRKYGG
jgi:arabinofuranan 3-O-arabinosyltransferase